jgi:heavy metal translocating P-type ATPase
LVTGAETCDLCGLSTDGRPVMQAFEGEEKAFCCQGCARVYELALQNGMLDAVLGQQRPRPVGFRETVLDPGQTLRFALEGMWCAGCATTAEHLLRHHPGVKSADVSFAAERGRLQYDPARVDPLVLLHKLDVLGYRARLLTDPKAQGGEWQQERMLRQLVVAAAFGMQVMLLYLVQLYPLYAAGQFDSQPVRNMQYLVWALATPVMFVGGLSFLKGAWRASWAGTATMDTLVALGTLSAYSYSAYVALVGGGEAYFDSVAMITTFVMLGRYLEKVGGAQARKDIRHLLELQPRQAWRRVEGGWQETEAAALSPGDEIMIKPGERVPVDAQVSEGEAAIDEALLTGESTPVNKGPGDTVYAGTLVADSTLICRVTRPVAETRLAQITALVERTLNTKPPIQRLADKASRYFALGIVATTIVTFVGWWATGRPAAQSLLTAVAVLVVACPCALGLATPLALATVLGRTSREGILVRNPGALETASTIRRIVFDKTGTLTEGRLAVVQAVVHPFTDLSAQGLICLAGDVEQFSEHPVGKAIVDACQRPAAKGTQFKALPGLGVSARVEGRGDVRILVGSSELVRVDGDQTLNGQARLRAQRGETIVWVGWGDQVAGFIALRDEPNPSARDALQQLNGEGLQAIMLSGDSPETTGAIAAELGIEQYEGRVSPAEKAQRIREWQNGGDKTAMAGDGVNDAPALAQADLSITTAAGTDVAGETSDLVLTRADLTLIPWFIRLSRRTRRIIYQNLGWAFAYNLVAVPLAAFGAISPVIAAGAMATSSLLVVGNSLRLRR